MEAELGTVTPSRAAKCPKRYGKHKNPPQDQVNVAAKDAEKGFVTQVTFCHEEAANLIHAYKEVRMHKRYAAAIGLLLAPLVFFSSDLVANVEHQPHTLRDVLDQASAALNRELPVMIDAETRLDSSAVIDGEFHYEYTLVNFEAADLDHTTFGESLKSQAIVRACDMEISRTLLDNGVILVYAYRGNGGVHLSSFAIRDSDCLR